MDNIKCMNKVTWWIENILIPNTQPWAADKDQSAHVLKSF